MARYTCTVEHWSDDSDEIRLFQAEVASYGHRRGHDPDGWEVVGKIVELDDLGNETQIVYPLGNGSPDSPTGHPGSPEVQAQRRLYSQVEELLITDAQKQWDEAEPDFGFFGP